jgi:catechol 2,3-dioxygenase-like lactoylglutathione lyase family enzyme
VRSALVPELIVSEIADSLSVYMGVFGFRVLYERPEERFAFLERERAQLMLEQPHRRDRLWPRAPFKRPFGRGVNLQIEVSDVEVLHRAVAASRLELILPLEERWYRRGGEEVGNRQFAVADPDGYVLRFFQDLGVRPAI